MKIETRDVAGVAAALGVFAAALVAIELWAWPPIIVAWVCYVLGGLVALLTRKP